MSANQWHEPIAERQVTYTLEIDGKLVIIEHVPAKVNLETGEQYFSPDTVERLQSMIWKRKKPSRVIQVPVFDFA